MILNRQSQDRFLANLEVDETTLEEIRRELKGCSMYWLYDYWGDMLGKGPREDNYDDLMLKSYEEVLKLSPTEQLTWFRAKGYTE